MMDERRDFALKFFLNKEPSRFEKLTRFLPVEEKQNLIQIPTCSLEENKIPNLPFESIHWSWFIPILQKYPVKEQKLFLNALHQQNQKHLTSELKITLGSVKTTHTLTAFLRNILWEHLTEKEHRLPIYFLPPSPLNVLLDIEKTKLTQLIDLLSLYDLSVELRQIVETKILKKIYSFLSEDEKKFLKTMAGYKEPYPTTRIGFDQWDGSERSFRLALHKRGLSRIGAALSGQHPDLIWYVCHHLDIGRGRSLMKLCSPEPIHGVSQPLIEQLKELFAQPETNL